MRKPAYLSPTSFALWERDPEEYYKRYLSDRRFPKDPQTMPMAVGSAFDFKVKNYLIQNLGSKMGGSQPKFELQIEPHNMPEADRYGDSVFEFYQKSGSLAALMLEVISGAKFEFAITGNVSFNGTEVPLNGRPDACFYSQGDFVILDWKVNGWMVPRNTSPKPGYVACYGVGGSLGHHKNATPISQNGLIINLCEEPEEWATQLSVYSWLLGNPVGKPFIGAIDQICGPAGAGARCAKHRFLIREDYQLQLFERMSGAWARISGQQPLFEEMTEEQIAARCSALDQQIIDPDGLAGA
jgi:hypothetical protein